MSTPSRTMMAAVLVSTRRFELQEFEMQRVVASTRYRWTLYERSPRKNGFRIIENKPTYGHRVDQLFEILDALNCEE